jgi:Holliday junction resolvase
MGLFEREKTVKDLSIIQERKLAKDLKGRTTIMSGALAKDKADITAGKLRIECKRTDKESISIKKEWLIKLKNGTKLSEIPVVAIQIQDEDWFLVRPEEFKYIEGEING